MSQSVKPCESLEARQFDFWLGEWDLTWPAEQTGGGAGEIGLRPGARVLEERIRLLNPTDGFHPYYFWNNTAFPATPGARFIYPMTLGSDHDGKQFFSWPEHEGRDLTWVRNHPGPTSIFWSGELPPDDTSRKSQPRASSAFE